MNEVAGVILDFDGVVVDSHVAHLEAWKIACQQLFQYPLKDIQRLVGRSGREIAYELANEAGYRQRALELYEFKTDLIYNRVGLIPLLPGAREFIAALEKNQIPWGIGSNARSQFITSVLDYYQLRHPEIVAYDRVSKPKPHPEMFITCAKNLSIDKSRFHEVLVFDDSPIGIRAALAAGMIAIGVTTQMSAHDLRNAGAHHICQDLAEALKNKWFQELP